MHPGIKRIIEYPKIAQRSPEWYEYRKKRVTTSEASTIIAQGKGYDRVFEQKVGIRDSHVSSEYMQIGTDNEEAVVKLYREKYPEEEVFHDLSIIPHPTLDYVAASLDACTASGINVEIKTVFKNDFVKVSKMYYDQVQLAADGSHRPRKNTFGTALYQDARSTYRRARDSARSRMVCEELQDFQGVCSKTQRVLSVHRR